MKQQDLITPRQLTAAAFVAMLSPLVRRFPRVTVATAGRSAWLSVPMAALLLIPVALGLWLFYRRAPKGSGFADLFCRALGPWPGRLLTGLYGLWLLFYAGFLLRSGANRFISTVYPGAGPAVFVLVMALLCLLAAAGRLCPIARTAMLFRPLLLALFALVFALTLRDLDLSLLLPVTAADLLPNSKAALQTANVLTTPIFLVFFSDRLKSGARWRGNTFAWAGAMLGVLLGMTVGCLGMFGAALTARMTYPFFMLVRDLSALGTLERAEPVVIALWVLSDFVMVSLLLQAAGKTLRFCARGPAKEGSSHRLLLPLIAAVAAVLALLLPAEAETFRFLSDKVVPLLHAAFAFVLPLPILLIGLARKRL